jgi:nucleolar protein 9
VELEANFKQTDMPGSFTDSILMGAITDHRKCSITHQGGTNSYQLSHFVDASPPIETPESDYIGTLLRDQTASHVLQTVIKHAPPYAFHHAWQTYFVGKLAKLADHPIANFVVTEAIGRLDEAELGGALSEVGRKLGKAVGGSSDSNGIWRPVLTGEKKKVGVVLSVRS